MGGCRCSFRNCTSATKTSENLHFFHYPVKNKERCALWIQNARKPQFSLLPEDQLRNKVVCEYHFEDRCFINQYKKRLVHNAVPTIDSIDSDVEVMNIGQDDNKKNYEEHININIIATNDDCTNFTLDTGSSPEVVDSTTIETYIYTNDDVVPVIKKSKYDEGYVRSVRHIEKTQNYPIKLEPTKNLQYMLVPENLDEVSKRTEIAVPEFHITKKGNPKQNLQNCRTDIEQVQEQITSEVEYVEQIRQNSKEIATLKKLLHRKKSIANAKKLKSINAVRKKVITKAQILQSLEKQISPALLTALSIDIYKKEKEFNDKEEQFLVDFYKKVTPSIYEVLKTSGWNFLPSIEVMKALLVKSKK